MKPNLVYIRKIEYCEAYHLRRAVILPAQAKALVREPMPWQELPTVGLASLEATEEVDKGVRITTVKLQAKLRCSITLPESPLSFRLTDVQGRTYLLGAFSAPHPLSTTSSQAAEATNGDGNFTINVCHKNANCILQFI